MTPKQQDQYLATLQKDFGTAKALRRERNTTLGEALASQREAAGVTRTALSLQLGFKGPQVLEHYENGRSFWSETLLTQYRDALELLKTLKG